MYDISAVLEMIAQTRRYTYYAANMIKGKMSMIKEEVSMIKE